MGNHSELEDVLPITELAASSTAEATNMTRLERIVRGILGTVVRRWAPDYPSSSLTLGRLEKYGPTR